MKNKIVLVTGATSGIGRATAILLAERGAKVIVAARREQMGQEVVEEIAAKGGEAVYLKMDVNSEESIREGIHWIVDKYGRLDAAVNNAGIVRIPTSLIDTEIKDLEEVFQTNVIGVFASMKNEIQHMLQTGGGAIVNVSSINGLRSMAKSGPYSSSKFAAQALTQSAALEFANQNIRINAVAPGPTTTEITAGLEPSIIKHLTDIIPMNRMGDSEEIAKGIVFLLSDESSFTTGATLVMDGGFTA
ncbi:SDR family NAD(P)-dependent oxidoreductase [Paenibacillus solisilvae]|uniref:SDR family NAD(P)-dependent oxidoreductase n=1 Tax=Paenibacillus solisilvae TaxID=2486751 RepID=A0ABW0VVV8_9BACL